MNGVKEVTAGVDWLTVRGIGFEDAHKLHLLSVKVLEENNVVLPAPRYARLNRYEGWRAGGLGYMVNDDRAILSLAGRLAQKYLKQVAEIEVVATRIDLAVDVLLSYQHSEAAYRYAQVLREENRAGQRGYHSALSLITGSDGGSTLYVGKRAGRLFARLYDKGVQSGAAPAGTLWRYEVEYKQDAARAVFSGLLEAERPRDYILGRVRTHFDQRGVYPLFWQGAAPGPLERDKEERTPLDRLNWLAAQVRPTVGRLRLAGYEVEVYNALGLPIPVVYYQKKEGE
jgi:hypothetical protein